MASGAEGFAAAYLSLDSGAVGMLTPDSPTAETLLAEVRTLASLPKQEVYDRLNRTGRLRAAVRPHDQRRADPARRLALRVRAGHQVGVGQSTSCRRARPSSSSAARRATRQATSAASCLTELITGGALIALLAVCGNWLIARGLAPLRRMAYTADLITRSGDLAARMPDAGGQQETGRLAAAINTMLDRIQHSFSARLRSEQKIRQFAADASHELRTPLTTIRGYAELYRANALGPDELPNAMRRIEQEAERMSMLVAELLELARLDRPSSLDLSETDLDRARQGRRGGRPGGGAGPRGEHAVPGSLVVTADEPRIRQVLANLLGNVRAHTPPGPRPPSGCIPNGNGAVIEVSDQGPGMSEHDAALAFDRFHRGDGALAAATTGRRKPGGRDGTEAASSGLGLSIVQAIADGARRPRQPHLRPGERAPPSASGSRAGALTVIPNGSLLPAAGTALSYGENP